MELAGNAAYRAKLADFDGVSIHAGGGYLLHQLLSTSFNKRTDKYGGDSEGRLKLLLEIIEEIRRTTGKGFPIIVRYLVGSYPPDECLEEREEIKEAKFIAKRLEEASVDAISITVRATGEEVILIPSMHFPENCLVPFAEVIKRAVKIPVIANGRIREPEFAEQILREGKADFIGMARPLIADPDLPKKYAEGHTLEIRSCIACNECIRSCIGGQIIRCTLNAKVGRELKYGTIKPSDLSKRVHGWLAGVAIVGPGKGINEGEIDSCSHLPKKMVLRDEAVKGELIV